MHHPVLLQKAIEGLKIKKGGLYIDATAGEGGHLKAILKKGAKVLAIDWDKGQLEKLGKILIRYKKSLVLVNGNFAQIKEIAEKNNFHPVDGVIFDLGLSMDQLNNGKRGFSFKQLSEPLDMRIGKDKTVQAKDIVNSFSEEEIYEILARYSEELNSRIIAKAIVRARSVKKIAMVEDLVRIIKKTINRKSEKVYSRIFQGLRIAVNNELENLKKGLKGATKLINKNGKIAVISFHSIEDRVVKKFIKKNCLKQLSFEKGNRNLSYERSAKLRIISKYV